MGGSKAQKYTCKICNKSCVSGKSLGGHMRVHLSLISSSKNASKPPKDDAEMELEDNKNPSNNSPAEEGPVKNPKINAIPDQNSSYKLRANPKKSCKFPDSERSTVSCEQCGREFPSLKALSGHMRSHYSIEHTEGNHKCKKCGKEFGSIRAMFGHMKCHSKRSQIIPDDENAAADHSLPELKNLCHIRRKRSRIKYKTSPNPSSLTASTPNVDEEDVAESLIMLSKGLDNQANFGSVVKSSNEIKTWDAPGIASNNGDEMLNVKIDDCASGSTNAVSEAVADEFGVGLDCPDDSRSSQCDESVKDGS